MMRGMSPIGKPRRPTLGPSAFLEAGAAARPADPGRAPGQAEASFFQRLAESARPVRVKLRDGSEMTGTVEWHDRGALRLNLIGGGHRVVPKSALAFVERLPDEAG